MQTLHSCLHCLDVIIGGNGAYRDTFPRFSANISLCAQKIQLPCYGVLIIHSYHILTALLNNTAAKSSVTCGVLDFLPCPA